MRIFIQILLLLATAPFLPSTASSQAAPVVTIELLEIDPADASVLPLKAQVHGRIRYTTNAPVRLFIGILLPKARSGRQAAHEHEPHSAGP